MVNTIIGVYKDRINKNTWLNAETKAKAILKLNTMKVHIGYPRELPKYYDKYKVGSYAEGSNLVKEKLKYSRLVQKKTLRNIIKTKS